MPVDPVAAWSFASGNGPYAVFCFVLITALIILWRQNLALQAEIRTVYQAFNAAAVEQRDAAHATTRAIEKFAEAIVAIRGTVADGTQASMAIRGLCDDILREVRSLPGRRAP